MGATPADIVRLGEADFNVVLYPETASQAAQWLARNLQQPMTKSVPLGVGATCDFIREVAELAGVDPTPVLAGAPSRATWYSRSVDSTYLTGKRVFIFGDATHAVAAARVATQELGFTVVGLGTYSREFAREIREAAKLYGVEPLISDDYLEVEEAVMAAQPELVLGTQMERHIAKRLGLPCAVISAPVHVQDFPARYAPQMGFEGANVLFDTWVAPLMMGLEEHLLGMFRGDFEFHENAPASHLGRTGVAAAAIAPMLESQSQDHTLQAPAPAPEPIEVISPKPAPSDSQVTTSMPSAAAVWDGEAQAELQKIPFFVRGKARKNTERYALERGVSLITVETLYDAKSHFAR
jgi:light-independent protochlorophyllide reductase subunit B